MKKDYSNLPTEDANKEFVSACIRNELDNVISLLSNSRLEPHITEDKFCIGFNWICGDKCFDIIKYLIFDYKIPKFEKIEAHIDTIDNEVVRNMFMIRELNQSLTVELPINNKVSSHVKI